MKALRPLAPTLALGALALVLAPPRSIAAFAVGALDLDHRDARVFDNFTDATANGNVTPHPNWPGFVGAELAIWKACSEWSSEPHDNNGLGDPTQPTIGDGGANFDVAWAGLAGQVGGLNDNTASEITSSGTPGLLAYTESAGGQGWRIRFESHWLWEDGPEATSFGSDIQGIATHEYGHALGLGHSTVAGATMGAITGGFGNASRSIELDDIQHLQALYGVMAATKPHVASASLVAGMLVIDGTDFGATDNEVWFTPAAATGAGVDPIVRVTGLASQPVGTRIDLFVPPAAGRGDLLVKSGAGSSFSHLSNAVAFDPTGAVQCAAPTVYCTSKINSQLCQPSIGSSGSPSASLPSPFTITGAEFLNNKNGLLFYGAQPNGAPFQGGHLCVKQPTKRTSLQSSGGNPPPADCSGTYAIDFNAHVQSGQDPQLIAGAAVFCQYWSRDPADLFGFNTSLSDAVQFVICQ